MNWITRITNHNMDSTNDPHLVTLSLKDMTNHMGRSRLTICACNTDHTHAISWVIKEVWNTRHHSLTCIRNGDNTHIIRYSNRFGYDNGNSTSSNRFIDVIVTINCSPIKSDEQAIWFYCSGISCYILNRYILITLYLLYI